MSAIEQNAIKQVEDGNGQLYKYSLEKYPYNHLQYYIGVNKFGEQMGFWLSDDQMIQDGQQEDELNKDYWTQLV